MELELVPPPDDAAGRRAVVRAVADAGVALEPRPGDASDWWHAGLAEAVDREPSAPFRPPSYEAAPSPRSTRGATRA
jgi:hypothetical protein